MIAPDLAGPERGHASPIAFDSFEGLPPLPSERLPEDFSHGQQVLTMFYRTWMEGPELIRARVSDISPDERPFRIRLPYRTSLESVIARVAEESGGQIDPEALRESSDEELRQHMLGVDDLRTLMPSAGHISVKTAKTDTIRGGGIVGIGMNDVTLIPSEVWPHLHDEAYLQALLRDGHANEGEREALEELLRERIAEGGIGLDVAEERRAERVHQPRRGRRHGALDSGKVGGVRADRHTSFAPEPRPVIIPEPSIEHI